MATATVTKLKNFIDGEFVDPAEGQTEEVVNPATGEPIAEAPLSTPEDVGRAVGAARKAFDDWSTKVPGERAQALLTRTAAEKRRCGSREATDALRRLDRAKTQAAGATPAGAAPATPPTPSSNSAPTATTTTVDSPSSTSIVPTPSPVKKIAKKKKRHNAKAKPTAATTAAQTPSTPPR